MRASRSFFARDALDVAPDLLGARLTIASPDGEVTVRVTETEAYHGLGTGGMHDGGSHARMGKTARNASMFGEPGHLYVYFSYGMHNAVNVVCSPAGRASGVLLRAGEIVAGEELARTRRPAAKASRDLARGPGRLAQALGLRYTEHDGMDALPDVWPLPGVTSALLELPDTPPAHVSSGPRTGVSGEAGTDAFPWRFWITDDPTVSPYRVAAPRRARRPASG